MIRRFATQLLTITALVFMSCENPAVETDADGRVRPAGLSFEYVTAANSSSSYTLRVDTNQWERNGDFNIYRHPGGDDYEGLQVTTQDQPVDDLSFEMSKNNDSLENYLGVDGAWIAQILGIQLPFGMFSQGFGLADGDQVDLSQFEYKFRMADSDIEVDAIYEIDEDANTVTVEVSSRGSIIVRLKQETTEEYVLALNSPDLDKQFYPDTDVKYRRFTWDAQGGTSACAINDAPYGQCTTNESMDLEASTFNAKPVLNVRVTREGVDYEASVDLGTPGTGLAKANILECTIVWKSGDGALDSISGITNQSVICIEPSALGYESVGGIQLINLREVKIIGHPGSKTTIRVNDPDDPAILYSSSGDQPGSLLVANLTFDVTDNTGVAIRLSGDATSSSSAYSNHKFENLEVSISGTNGKGILSDKEHFTVNESLFSLVSGSTESSAIFAIGTTANVTKSHFIFAGGSIGRVIALNGQIQPSGNSLFSDNYVDRDTNDHEAIKIFNSVAGNNSVRLAITNSAFRTQGHSISSYGGTALDTLEIYETQFRHNNEFVSPNPLQPIKFAVGGSTSYSLKGNTNTFCNEGPDHAYNNYTVGDGINSTGGQWLVDFDPFQSIPCPENPFIEE